MEYLLRLPLSPDVQTYVDKQPGKTRACQNARDGKMIKVVAMK
jgi:hypothetical protein